MEEVFCIRFGAPLFYLLFPCLLRVAVVFLDGIAPAGRGGEGSGRVEMG